MTRLAVEAEIIKLAHILGVSQTQLNFLKPLAPESLRQFRFGIIEQNSLYTTKKDNSLK